MVSLLLNTKIQNSEFRIQNSELNLLPVKVAQTFTTQILPFAKNGGPNAGNSLVFGDSIIKFIEPLKALSALRLAINRVLKKNVASTK